MKFLGYLAFVLGVVWAGLSWITYQRLFMHVPMGNRPLLSLGVMLVIIGLQFLVFGLLAEVLARTYYESQNKKTYIVRRVFSAAQSDNSALWNRKVAN